ncbi:hypothetical protein [Ktedonobacter racemifer]|uniref:Uncharacterized protein n=1 Tax=Ktedonobacter racemifer DSM 44963 TaxID=485913 RepID=D6TSF4_KTERA|nr:hypothetical protein [Ktedonobacter racemifer]EFH83355.1 hypothetical protein Krac_4311 [Ktedonobacter racemifer DSM 44963]
MSRRNKHPHKSTSTTQERLTPQSNKPARGQRRYRQKTSWWSILLTGVGIVLVGLMAVFGFRFFSSLNTTATPSLSPATEDAVTPTIPGDNSTGDSSNLGQKTSSPWSNQEFVSTVLGHLAEKFNLSLDQLSKQVQSGLQIEDVAAQHGISVDQLHTIEINALQTGIDKLTSTNQMSQDEASIMMHDFKNKTQQKLNGVFTYELGGTPPIPTNATPTILPK